MRSKTDGEAGLQTSRILTLAAEPVGGRKTHARNFPAGQPLAGLRAETLVWLVPGGLTSTRGARPVLSSELGLLRGCLPSRTHDPCLRNRHLSGGGAAADVFVEDARDQGLIRKPFLGSAPFEHLEVGGRQTDIDARVFPQITPGRLDCGLLRSVLVLHGPEFALFIGRDQVFFLIVVKSAVFHEGSPSPRRLVALRLG